MRQEASRDAIQELMNKRRARDDTDVVTGNRRNGNIKHVKKKNLNSFMVKMQMHSTQTRSDDNNPFAISPRHTQQDFGNG